MSAGVPSSAGDGAAATREFFRTLRHDLRTPINHIIGYSELLLEEAEDRGRDAYGPDLEKIRLAGRELLALVNDCLDASRVEVGKVDLDTLSRDLRTPLNAIVGYSDLLREEAEDEGPADFIPDLERIHGAGKHLLSLVNAVLDLTRLEGTQSPAAAASVTAPAPSSPSGGARSPAAEHGSLLVVDDDASNRDMLSRRLERLGYTVATAEHGRAALERLRAEPFDLVLLDVQMPELNGYQVLQRLQADERLRQLPVIVLSASDEVESAVRCIQLGAEDYLPKPFDSVLLKARISASLEKKSLRDQEGIYLREIEAAKRRSDELLHVILPAEIVEELKVTNEVRPRRHEHVAVLFCDIVGFTGYCDRREPHEVIPDLQRLVQAYEEIALRHGLQKIKTIGDSFMAAGGLLRPLESPVLSAVRAGLEMIAAAQALEAGWNVRVGIHVGPVIAGILGQRQYLFDLFGDTVNTAARVESYGLPGSVTLSEVAWRQIADRSVGESLGLVEVKGKGPLELFRFRSVRAPRQAG